MNKPLVTQADVVVSQRGHDAGSVMLVVGMQGDRFALVCDGKLRMAERPKLKNCAHIQKIGRSQQAEERLGSGHQLSNSEIRKMLLPFSIRLGRKEP